MSYSGPERRGSRLSRFWQNIVPLIALVLAGWSIFINGDKVDEAALDAREARSAASQQREGRAIAIEVLCGGLTGVQRAGRLTLLGELPGVPEIPPETPAEERLREAYANSYVGIITTATIDVAGVRATGVINRDGTINCARLRRAAGADPQSPPAVTPSRTPSPTPSSDG